MTSPNPDTTINWAIVETQTANLLSLVQRQLVNSANYVLLVHNTINLTMLKGWHADNVVPGHCEAILDVRLLPDDDVSKFLAGLRSIINNPRISITVENQPQLQSIMLGNTVTSYNTPFYQHLTETIQKFGPAGQIIPYLTPWATDSRFFRAAGVKAYGFVPMLLDNSELSRIHGVDERVSTANLSWGIQVVFETLKRLCL